MDLIFFENDRFCQIFNINFNKILWIFFKRLFQEYAMNNSQKKSQN
jgi:hypothetical protein